MKPTIAQMNKWFNEFNATVFANELPLVPISFNNTRRQLGAFHWSVRSGQKITISLFYDRTEEQYRNCLLHEMCHLYCYHQGWRNEHHGPHWQTIARKATRITGLKIQRCENISGWEASNKTNKARLEKVEAKKSAPYVIVDVEYPDFHFIIKTTKKVISENSVGEHLGIYSTPDMPGKLCGVYVSSNPRFKGWSVSRSLNRGHKATYFDYKREFVPILEKALKVGSIRDLTKRGTYDCLNVQ